VLVITAVDSNQRFKKPLQKRRCGSREHGMETLTNLVEKEKFIFPRFM